MSDSDFQLAYEGQALDDHTMDVQLLAPALLAVGNLCREANRVINGSQAEVTVRVTSDFEHKCFQVNFTIVQSFLEQLRGLLHADGVTTAVELLTLLGLLGVPKVVTVLGLFKKRKGRGMTVVRESRADGTVTVEVEGDGNQVTVDRNVYNLSVDPRVLEAYKGVVAPTLVPGIESLSFRQNDKVTERISKDEARDILVLAARHQDHEPEVAPQEIEAVLRIHSVVFDADSHGKWTFWYGQTKIKADVSATTIPAQIVQRGMANIDDRWRVVLQIRQRKNEKGLEVNDYKIIKVLEYFPGPRQHSLALKPQKGGD